ncbi:MAG TPA: chemotaxis protein CheW [Anaeromyxobacter sp.]|nr:chemotaxis protein CheW [Anaeromyxobacter sp.]
MSSAADAVERQQYLAFTLAGGEYAVGILKVKEILQYEELTRVPSTPRSIRGVLNLRGSVIPVVDLAVKFGLPEPAVTKRTCVLVVETAFGGIPTVMGVVADAVSEVIELGPDDIEAPPAFGTRVRVDHLVGMGKVGKKFVLLLDIDKVLSADEHDLAAAAALGQVPAAVPAGEAPAP